MKTENRIAALEEALEATTAEMLGLKVAIMAVLPLMRLSRNDLESARLVVFDQVADACEEAGIPDAQQQSTCAIAHALFEPAVQVAQLFHRTPKPGQRKPDTGAGCRT